MEIQTFRAATLQEALQLVRQRIGPDASVLQTREVRQGLLARRAIEVQAVREIPSANRSSPAIHLYQPKVASSVTQTVPVSIADSASGSNDLPAGQEPSYGEISMSGSVHAVFQEVLDAGVDANLAQRLLNQAMRECDHNHTDDAWLIRGSLVETVAKQLNVASHLNPLPNEQRTLMMVGPSGSGKSSLLAKISMRAHVDDGSSIGIVLMDAWRSATIEPLLEHADQVSASVEVVGSSDQLVPALQRLRECDLVLMDTTGCSPQNAQQMRQLNELFHIAGPDEVHVVLGANTAPAFASAAIDAYSQIGASHLALTGLDEAIGTGSWLSQLLQCPLPMRYLTHGRSPEGHLLSASPRSLASILLQHRKLSA